MKREINFSKNKKAGVTLCLDGMDFTITIMEVIGDHPINSDIGKISTGNETVLCFHDTDSINTLLKMLVKLKGYMEEPLYPYVC